MENIVAVIARIRQTRKGRELFDGMWAFVPCRVVLPGPLAGVTPVVGGSRSAGEGVLSAGSVGGRI